jgi:hypothetical protein
MSVGTPHTGAGQKAVYVKSAAITTLSDTDLLDGATKAVVSKKTDMAEVTQQGDSFKTFIPGLQEYTITVEGNFQRGSTVGDLIRAAWLAKTKIYVAIIETPDAAALAELGKCYPVYVAEDPFDFDVNGLSTIKLSFILAAAATVISAP